MRPRTTLLLLLIVVSLASFIYFYEQHQQTTLELRTPGSLTNLEVDKIDSIEIQNASGTAKLKRKDDQQTWFFTDPFDDRVDAEFIQRLLDLAGKAGVAQTIAAKDVQASDRKAYGLDDKEAIQLSWRVSGKTVGKLKIGKIGALGDTVYAEAPGHKGFPDCYLIYARPTERSSNLREELVRPFTDLRDRKLLPFSTPQMVSFSIRRPGTAGEIQVQRKLISKDEATPWAITKPLKTRAEQTEIDNWTGLFGTAHAVKLLTPGAAPTDAPAAPEVEIQFQNELESKGTIVKLYAPEKPDAATLYGYLADRKTWFTIESGFLTTVPKTINDPPTDPPSSPHLRSLKLADLDAKKLTTLLIQTEGQPPLALYKIGNRWWMQSGTVAEEQKMTTLAKASGDRVTKVVQALNGAEIGKFVTDAMTDPAEYGLDHPWQTITLGSAVHSPQGLGVTTAENSLILQFGTGADQRLYGNFKGESSVYLMLPEHFRLVPPQPLKWKDPQILNFVRNGIRRFQQTLGTEPPITLSSPPQSFSFAATRGGGDVTKLIDQLATEKALSRLSTLNVADWMSGLQEGHDALTAPTLELELDIEYVENRNDLSAPKTKTVKLSLAPAGGSGKALYYIGRCTDIPDYFLISREVYQELATPLLKAE